MMAIVFKFFAFAFSVILIWPNEKIFYYNRENTRKCLFRTERRLRTSENKTLALLQTKSASLLFIQEQEKFHFMECTGSEKQERKLSFNSRLNFANR